MNTSRNLPSSYSILSNYQKTEYEISDFQPNMDDALSTQVHESEICINGGLIQNNESSEGMKFSSEPKVLSNDCNMESFLEEVACGSVVGGGGLGVEILEVVDPMMESAVKKDMDMVEMAPQTSV